MKRPKIIVHCLVKNEENFIWYAVNSVLPYVDKIMIWDNGSTDKTVEIIKTINSSKIVFEEHPVISREAIGHLRQDMLDNTPKEFDWLLILDGDEVWSEKSIKKVIDFISENPSTETIITRTYNLVGDIYHRLPEKFGGYTFLGKKGNYSLRFINLHTIPGLHASSPYGSEGYFDKNNLPIQNRAGLVYVDTEYYHATHLIRSSQNNLVMDRVKKLKNYLGEENPSINIPEIFFSNKPSIVPDISKHMSIGKFVLCVLETIPRKIKRIFIPTKSEY